MSEEVNIPEKTLETLAHSFYKESKQYGFRRVDYVRFVNNLLELAMHGDGIEYQSIQRSSNGFDQEIPISLPLKGPRVMIRPYHPEKDKIYAQWLKDMDGRFFLLSRVSLRRTDLDALVYDPSNTIATITLHDHTPIGAVAFLKHDQVQHKAELRKLVGSPEYRGKGYAHEATQLWVRYGLWGMGLHKIYLNTLNTNLRNIKLNEELGFKVEGILRDEVVIDGTYRDVLRMSLLRPQ
ncbi:GNAT family N-acetyltransferase [candidate division KSB1 bacterium]|nr:GNAT family N-acetyltransferase [candidate division KSB1 bacterium]